ncbi:hypothetical protein vseg_020052 [Gypsophila vaccaria]
MEEEKLRIRLVFNNEMLTKSQKKNGLKRSWVLLKPHFLTISDVVSYILHSFHLLHSCPHGIILSMDGFVLPEFESTSILKDKDLIRVKRKATRLLGANNANEEAEIYIEDEIVEKQPLASGVKLLANEEFNRETTGHQNETDNVKDKSVKSRSPVPKVRKGDLASKKRKASSKLETIKKKRKLQAVVKTVKETQVHDCEDTDITIPTKKRKYKNRSDQNGLACPDVTVENTNVLKPESDTEDEFDENKEDTVQASTVPDTAKKVSRSTVRKKRQREIKKMLRDKAKSDEQCDGQQPAKDVTTDAGPEKDVVATIVEQDDEEDGDADGDLVPVEIRPGLIRFIPSGKVKEVQENLEANDVDVHSTQNGSFEEQSAPKNVSDVKHTQVSKEAYCWNGVTNKRKGQKWGQETQSTSRWKESRNMNTHSSDIRDGKKQSTSSWKDSWAVNGDCYESDNINGQSNNTCADKMQTSRNKSVDFDKLVPLTGLPKVGDVIVYRLLELTSSWCPELSSFRVGKLTSVDADSNRVMLVPVPEYPLNLEKHNDDDKLPFQSAAYNEDGSLETDFLSLNDVRLMKLGDVTQTEGVNIVAAIGNSSPSTSKRNDGAEGSKKAASDVSNQGMQVPVPANGKDVWDEAVSEKKSKLMHEDSWNKKVTPAKRPWSHRSLRSSATMARLRSRNGA